MFLGETEQNRLTILVTQRTMYKEDVEVVANEMRRQDSMIFSEAIARGARIAATRSDWRKSECIDVLRAYSSRGSISPPIHRAELRDSLPRFRACSCAEEAVGYRKKETTCAESRFPAYDEQIEKLNSSLEESNANLTHHQKIIEQLRADQQITESVLNQRIQAVQEEYASLRSQVQLQDNSEQEDIVQTLLGLNRCIEDFGTQISTYLVENHVQVAFGKNSSNLTTLDAHRLSKLRSWFGYDGKPSLIEPSAGVGLEIDDFFDFSIRHLLCLVLATYIFRPFHPCIPSSESERFIEVYEEVQKQGNAVRYYCAFKTKGHILSRIPIHGGEVALDCLQKRKQWWSLANSDRCDCQASTTFCAELPGSLNRVFFRAGTRRHPSGTTAPRQLISNF